MAGVELFNAERARPGAFWRCIKGWRQAVHVVATVTVITEQQLVIVITSTAN